MTNRLTKRFILHIILGFLSFQAAYSQAERNPFRQSFSLCEKLDKRDANYIASDNEKLIYLFSDKGGIEAFELDAEKSLLKISELWSSDIGGQFIQDPIIVKENIVFVTARSLGSIEKTGFSLTSLNSGTGITEWRKDFNDADFIRLYESPQKLVVIKKIKSDDHFTLYLFEPETGALKKSLIMGGSVDNKYDIPNISIHGERLLFSHGRMIRVISLENLREEAFFEIDQPPSLLYLLDTEKFVYADERGNLGLKIISNKEENITLKLGGKVTQVKNRKDLILAVSNDNFLYALNRKLSKIKWKLRFPGRISANLFSAENYIVSFAQDDSSLMFIDPSDGKIINRIDIDEKERIQDFSILKSGVVIIRTIDDLKLFASGCGQ